MRHQGGIFSKIELVKNFDRFDKQKHSSQSRMHAIRPYVSPHIYIKNFRMEIFTLIPLLRMACGKALFLSPFLLEQQKKGDKKLLKKKKGQVLRPALFILIHTGN